MPRHFERLLTVGFAALAVSATVRGQTIGFLGVPSGEGQGNISRTDPSCTVSDDTITCPHGGILVQFSIYATGWDPYSQDNGLAIVQGVVEGATLHNGLYQILPLGYGADRTIGAYQVVNICFMGASDGLACGQAGNGPFGPGLPGVTWQDCTADGGLYCVPNDDFILSCCDPIRGVATPTSLEYGWGAMTGPSATHGAIDDGTRHYLGDYVLEVPIGAGGEWTIRWLDAPDITFMNIDWAFNIDIENLLPGILRIPLDCNENGVDDLAEIANGSSQDCDGNGFLDECDIATGEPDCDANGVPDECEIPPIGPPEGDCNTNGVPDACDIAAGEPDCDANGVPDACQIPPIGPAEGDCNTNSVPDVCDIAAGEPDCDANGVPDVCDIAAGDSSDCNTNGVPDVCDIASGDSSDCNLNAVPDGCDIADGTSLDDDENGIPDECRHMPRLVLGDVKKNRYVSFIPTNLTDTLALRVDILNSAYFPESIGQIGWVSEPDANGRAYVVAEPVMRVWTDQTIHLGDCHIVPATTYGVRAFDGTELFAPLAVGTIDQPRLGSFWADSVGDFDDGQWTPPNGIVNLLDISSVVRSFQQRPTAPHITRSDIHPEVPNWIVNFADIQQFVYAFQSREYPYSSPTDCP